MAQQVRCLPWEGSSNSQKLHKKPGGLGGLSVIPAPEQTQKIPGTSQTNQMNQLDQQDWALKQSPASGTLHKVKSEPGHFTSTSGLHMHVCTCAHTDKQAYRYLCTLYTHTYANKNCRSYSSVADRSPNMYVQGPKVKKKSFNLSHIIKLQENGYKTNRKKQAKTSAIQLIWRKLHTSINMDFFSGWWVGRIFQKC